ncbi:UDP-N-acetylmuramate dehydrogenase [Synechococcales cyanobacterium C]|uniref:UDP-N-acetylenolpyruvoylglucosamine reductase n=1 Tax=Petrachloros mirabilis ULC683 TaxID=2781853 RepID=A0A8K2ANF2_9CYAN|nr:UDP-N-acetylmuramate dehydrogenase [Petrachloros mirabilis]NCJ05703.1 UDP-N-acetylmuramate dehydrogenase [Petrachloros mirabilis ULC683]
MTQALSSPLPLPEIDLPIQANASLANLTTFRVGGKAEWLASPHSVEEIQACYAWASDQGLPVMLIGAGSNLLISDRGLSGLILSTRHLRQQTLEPTGRLCVEAGKPLPRLAWQVARRGWSGLEWAVGIPGTVGGAVVMNAGAHGGCMADSLVEAHVISQSGRLQILTKDDLKYGYRTSILQQSPQVLVRAVLQLMPGQSPAEISALTQSHLDHRLQTQPYDHPSCGSVFRNPQPQTAGWLIEQTGLKGHQIGGAQVSEKHANFILNRGHATAQDIHTLIYEIQARVQARWGVLLHPEVKMLGIFDAVTEDGLDTGTVTGTVTS